MFSAPEDFRRDVRTGPAVFKIHGSVTDSTTIVDTVSQKLRGLGVPVRGRLIELFQRHHVLVAGFSGADLAFGPDYPAFSALKAGREGITWVVEPGRTLRPQAAAILRAAGGVGLEATLSDVFTRLGVPVAASPAGVAGERAPGQAEADSRARARIAHWLESLGGGPLTALLFCTELADQLGWRAEANLLRAALRSGLEGRTTLPINAIVAFNLLASGADEAGDYRACEYWARRVLAMWAQFERLRQGVPVGPTGMREMTGQYITGLVQLGRARAGLGDATGAREALERARQASQRIDDRTRLSALLMNEVLLLRREHRAVEEQITLSRRAGAIATASGSAQIMTEAGLMEAYALATIGEYDAALEALARAERPVRWSGRLLPRLTPQLLRAELAARRGDPDQAADMFERAIALAVTDPVVEARLRLVTVATLAFHAPFLARALAHLDHVLAAMAEGRIPRDGTNAHLASEADVQQLPARVKDIAAVGVPGFLGVPDGVPGAEHGLRGALLKAEYEGDAAAEIEATGDELAIGKRDAMLASLRSHHVGARGPSPILFGGREMAVTAEEIAQLRSQSESPEERCDIAVLALSGGHTRAAIDLVLEAQASFHRAHDALGQARCFHLLADATQLEGRWDTALDFTRHALALEEDVQDVQGQIGSYGALALQFVEVGRFDGAEWAATACLTRVGPDGRSRFTVVARYALAEVHRRAGNAYRARQEARLARQEMEVASDPPPGSMLRRWLEPRLATFTRRRMVLSWLSRLARRQRRA